MTTAGLCRLRTLPPMGFGQWLRSSKSRRGHWPGGCWNAAPPGTRWSSSRAARLRDLCLSLLPALAPLARATALPPAKRARAIADVYGQLTAHDFSRDVLAHATGLLLAHPSVFSAGSTGIRPSHRFGCLHDADRALRLRGLPESVRAVARDGDVTLTGTVEWLYLKTASEVALRHIQGIRRVINQIVVIPQAAQIRR